MAKKPEETNDFSFPGFSDTAQLTPKTAKPHHTGHRDRLRQRFRTAPDALADYELLELLLFRTIARADTKPLAKALLARFGSLAEVLGAPEKLIAEVPGAGASVALECALRHPESVAGVVVVSGYYFPKPHPAMALAALPAVPILGTIARYTVLPLLARKAWPLVLEKMFRPAPIAPRFAASLEELSAAPEALRSVAAESALLIAASAMVPDYGRIRVPVGILAGAADDVIPAVEQAELLKAAIPGAHLEIVPLTGHMVQQTAPDAVLAMIDRIETARRAA